MVQITRKAFDRMVEEAIASLPPEYAQWLEEVPVIVEDRPSRADLEGARESGEGEAGEDEPPLGMFVGPSIGEGEGISGAIPARVMIYRDPLMQACDTREQLAEEIRKTLVHEFGHYVGMDEDELDDRGYGGLEEDDDVDFDIDR